jgi:hypothetical protein
VKILFMSCIAANGQLVKDTENKNFGQMGSLPLKLKAEFLWERLAEDQVMLYFTFTIHTHTRY